MTDFVEWERRARQLMLAAFHALRSYQYGNSSPDLAETLAGQLEVFLKEKAGKP
jgi:hypothetical protein